MSKTSLKNIISATDFNSWDVIQVLPAAIYICDIQGRIIFYNKAAVELWGKEPELGKDLWGGSWKMYDNEAKPLALDKCSMAITLKQGHPVNGEETIIERPNGTKISILSHPKPIFNPEGQLIGAVNMLIDITETKKKELAIRENKTSYKLLSESVEKRVDERTLSLKKSEERYYKMIEEVEDYAILLLDTEGYILNWNRGAEKIKGYSEKEILGKNFRLFYRDIDRREMLPEKLIHEAATTGKAKHEGWRLRKDGTTFWGYIVLTALHDSSGNIIGYSKVTRDLTERKIAEDQMKANTRNIEQQNRQLDEFAHITSHDLQEPLRKISTFAGILEDKLDDREAAVKNLEKIKSASRRMSVLIKDILQYSKLSKIEDLISKTDLNIVLKNVLDDLDLLIEEKQATIHYPLLPTVEGISVQLHQLFFNLIGNALKFTQEKPVIEISFEMLSKTNAKKIPQLDSNKKYLKLEFKDNGIGFEQQYAQKIFEMFQRLGDRSSGTGIGLALCKKIVENHNGVITVKSEPGKGTIFTVFLPV